MSWLKTNISIGQWITIIVLVIGFVSSYAVETYKEEDIQKRVETMEPEVRANSTHRSNLDTHMPYSEKVKSFVPRTEFGVVQEDIREIKGDIKLILQRLPQ